MATFTYNFPTSILSGPGSIRELPKLLKKHKVRRPLLVTDRTVTQLSFTKEILAELKRNRLPTLEFSEVWGNPDLPQVLQGLKAFKQHKADSFIGLGGGAALDVTKAIAVLVNHKGNLFDYQDVEGAKPINKVVPFILTIPTTAGTGSEVGRSTVISDPDTKIKKIIFSPKLLAGQVLLDPHLTLELPAEVTASTGMDALTHLIEAYLAKGDNPLCDGIALEGIRLVANSLSRCCKFAKDQTGPTEEHVNARWDMQKAAMMGAVAFQKGLGVTHSCAHALSTVTNMHHGLANAIVLPHTLRFNYETCKDRFQIMASVVGLKNGIDFVDWIKKLNETLGIPSSLAKVGVSKKEINQLTKVAVHDVCHTLNPRPVNRDDFSNLFNLSL